MSLDTRIPMEKSNLRRGTAIVTGARQGIGAGIARALAQSGFDIAVADIVDDDSTAQTVSWLRKTGVAAEFIRCDIGDIDAHEALISTAAAIGPIACLANNAGVNIRGDVLDVTAQAFDRVMDVNLRGTYFLTQAVARHMLDDPLPPINRSIVIISSANAAMASPEKAVYCLSKAALAMAVKLYAARLADAGIDVFEIQPGFIKTPMSEPVRERYGRAIENGASLTRRWGEPDDVGRVVAALATGQLPYCTGTMIPVGGGLHVHRL